MKCKDCIYLDLMQKSKVGYVCTNTKRRMSRLRTLGHLKYKHTPACKTGFKAKEDVEIPTWKQNTMNRFERVE